MNILIIGSGGREHALTWKVAQSPQVNHIWVAPGNAGTALEAKTDNITIAADAVDELLNFAKTKAIDLTIVGPEAPLAAGIVDVFQQAGLAIFGPSQQAAELETSKAFCKAFMRDNHIPTANYATFSDQQAALDYLGQQTFPLVIKASGLAAGKGVVIVENVDQGEQTVIAMMEQQQFGHAGDEIVIEEFLAGEELSFIALVDGKHILPLASSRDHKKRDDGDAGPNTGGMGAYSPVAISQQLQQQIMREVMQPIVTALKKQGRPYVGFLYAGLMIMPHHQLKVLEFNVRLGDPETQPLLMRMRSDLVTLILAALDGKLDQVSIDWDPRAALTVVMAAGGYPFQYEKGKVIAGLDRINDNDAKVFHAGTTLNNNDIVTNGGRVLGVTALGNGLIEAQQNTYKAVKQITWPDCYYRHDIGS